MRNDPLNRLTTGDGTQKKRRSGDGYYILFLAVLGLYANAAVYGFQYPAGADYNLFLPMANWLRDPSLYPGDAIRDAFPHIQTFYWHVVAILSQHYSAGHILFTLFLITKLIFFGSIGLLLGTRVRNRFLGACMVMAIGLSGTLNNQTPIGGTIILDEISEHAALAVAIALFAGVFLAEGKWRSAALLAGISAYVDALQFIQILPAFAFFAIVDWRKQRRQIIGAALLGAGAFLPWFVHFRRSFLTNYPSDYVFALLVHYPLHITLRWTPVSQIIEAATLLIAAVCMSFIARKGGLQLERRLELLAVSYFTVMLVGIVAGWFWLTPSVARFMLQRADSLLIPYAFLLIQIYAARLLESPIVHRPATTCLLAVLAILCPLSNYVTIVLFPAMILWLKPPEWLERYVVAAFERSRKSISTISTSRMVAGLCCVGVLVSFVLLTSSVDQWWNFHIPASPDESACYDAQIWAQAHTLREATFMVPPAGCGFRVLSYRSSWGEWSDGNAMYFYPAFADTFLGRVKVLDQTPRPQGAGIVDFMMEAYKNQSWDRIRSVANENKLDYIVQFRSVQYPIEPVYANERFAIYNAR